MNDLTTAIKTHWESDATLSAIKFTTLTAGNIRALKPDTVIPYPYARLSSPDGTLEPTLGECYADIVTLQFSLFKGGFDEGGPLMKLITTSFDRKKLSLAGGLSASFARTTPRQFTEDEDKDAAGNLIFHWFCLYRCFVQRSF